MFPGLQTTRTGHTVFAESRVCRTGLPRETVLLPTAPVKRLSMQTVTLPATYSGIGIISCTLAQILEGLYVFWPINPSFKSFCFHPLAFSNDNLALKLLVYVEVIDKETDIPRQMFEHHIPEL